MGTICTNGSFSHYDGSRHLTERELAALQTFPHDYLFKGPTIGSIKKQIGNSVPPLLAEVLWRSIVKHLRRADLENNTDT